MLGFGAIAHTALAAVPAASTVLIKPAPAVLALTGSSSLSPSVFAPASAALRLVGGNSTVRFGKTPNTGSLALTGNAPTVLVPLIGASAILALNGAPALLQISLIVVPAAASLGLVGRTPVLKNNVVPATGSLHLSTTTPSLATKYFTPFARNLSLTRFAPTATVTIPARPTAGSLSLTRNAPVLRFKTPSTRSLSLSPTTPVVVIRNTIANPARGSLRLTGIAPTIVSEYSNLPIFPLQALIVRETYIVSPVDEILRSELDRGPPRYRRRFSKSTYSVKFNIIMSQSDIQIFKGFFTSTLRQGSRQFAINLFDGELTQVYRVRWDFSRVPYSVSDFGINYSQVTFNLIAYK